MTRKFPNVELYRLLKRRWRGQVRHYANGRVYAVVGVALRMTANTVRQEVVYRDAADGRLYTQSLSRFCGVVGGVPRFSVAEA